MSDLREGGARRIRENPMRKVLNAGDLVKVAGGLDVVGVGASEVMQHQFASRRRGARVILLIQELQLSSRLMLQ
jgi:hypothetical protein